MTRSTHIADDTAEWAANLLGYRARPQPHTEPATTVFTLTRPDWHSHASCRGRDGWFPERGEDTRTQVAICGGCPVRVECAQYAADNPSETQVGIWGGLTGVKWRALRTRQRAEVAA